MGCQQSPIAQIGGYDNLESTNVLLEAEISIHGYEDIEPAFRQRKKLAVLLAGPARLRDGLNLVAEEAVLEAPRKALVKQNAHLRRGPSWLAPGQQPQVPH